MPEKSKETPISKYLCHAKIKMRGNELWDVTPASVDGQKLKAHKVILSASSIFFKKLSSINVHKKNGEWKSLVTSIYTKKNWKKPGGALCVINH